MVRPESDESEYTRGYQQALDRLRALCRFIPDGVFEVVCDRHFKDTRAG